MSSAVGLIEFALEFEDLASDHAAWSQATFGSDSERGPVGPLRHLEKEAREAAENPTDRSEYADCFLLILDAARRAGIKPRELVKAAQAKLEVNKRRTWPKSEPDMPVEHVEAAVKGGG